MQLLNLIIGLGCSSVTQSFSSMREALGLIPAPKQKRQKKFFDYKSCVKNMKKCLLCIKWAKKFLYTKL
jgi:hypothetical protein